MSADGIQATVNLLKSRFSEYDFQRARDRLTNAVSRGAFAGFALRGSLHSATAALRLLTTRNLGLPKEGRPGVKDLVLDTIRWMVFLGTFSGSFVAADELIALLGGKSRTQAWRSMAAGALAGPTLLFTGRNATHTSFSLYIFIRGIALLVRCGNLPTASSWKRRVLAVTRWKHGDTALVCLCTMQIGYSWIVLPSTLPPSYIRFLNKHGGKDLSVYDGVREIVQRGGKPGPVKALLSSRLHVNHTSPRPCAFLHPGKGCSTHALAFLPEAYLRALPVYVPVYVLPAILVHRKRLLSAEKGPTLWRKIAVGACRSAAFLALYCCLAWRGACAGFQLSGAATGWGIAMSCWVAGFATLVEKKSRRMELALYCTSRAVESFFLCTVAWGWVQPGKVPKRIDVLLFCLGAACICHCYSDHGGKRRDVFKSKYLSVLDFILGNVGFEEESIRHSPSNMDLLDSLEKRLEANSSTFRLKMVRSVKSLSSGLGSLGHQAHEDG